MDAVRLPGWEAPQQQQQHGMAAMDWDVPPDGNQHAAAAPDPQQQQQQPHGTAAMDLDAPPDGNQHAAVAPDPQQQQPEPRRPAVVGGVGVLALDGHVTAPRLAAMLAEAREFAAEWRELRGLHQARLQGRVLRAPLDKVGGRAWPRAGAGSCWVVQCAVCSSKAGAEDSIGDCGVAKGSHAILVLHPPPSCPLTLQAAEEVDRLAAASGKLGVSTNRFVDEQRSDLAAPSGAEWKPVRVAFKRCVGSSGGPA